MKPVDKRLTKDEILAAYQQLQAQMDSATTTPTLPTTSLKTTTTSLQKSIDALVSFKSSLDDLITNLQSQKQTQLEDEQRAQTELQQFRQDMKRAQLEQEYELKRTRKEHSDELIAELASTRREHEDTLRQERLAIQAQKDELAEKAQELKSLRQQVADFPEKLERDIAAAVNQARGEEQHTAKVARDLLEKQLEGERAVTELKVTTLEQTVKSQSQEVASLKSQLENSTRQVKDIAVSVIDSRRPLSPDSTPQ